MTSSVKAKALVLAVFLIGVVSGTVATNIYDARVQGQVTTTPGSRPRGGDRDRTPGRENGRERVFSYLKLTDEQKVQFQKIMDETRSEYVQLQTKTQPEFEAIRQRSFARIAEILTEEQRKLHEEMVNRSRDRMRGRGGGRNPGMNPPGPR